MKINSNQAESIVKMYQNRGNEGKDKAEKSDVKRPRDDSYSPSPTARELIRLKDRFNAISSIRGKMVEEIKQKVKDGTYQIRGQRVAEKMINREMVDFLIERGEGQV